MMPWFSPVLAQAAVGTDAESAVPFGDRVLQLLAPNGRLGIAFVLAVIGLWLLLPTGRADWRRTGSLLCVVAGCFFASLFQPLGDLLTTCTFSILASITVVSAVSTIASRNPMYSAIWFAVTLLGTGGLFLLNGAHFLGVATVAVYAGAIVVTFLFVLMLAKPEGQAFYDRISWGGTPAALAAIAGLLIVVATVWNVQAFGVSSPERPTAVQVLNEQHVAALGGNLFTKHIIVIQAAGVLLFAALVGAVAIAGRDQLIGHQVGSAVDQVLKARLDTNAGGDHA
jgi:NADH-quinone oxidoreductase subunit J